MRFKKLDYIRALAVILMIFFHLNYILVEIFSINFLNHFPIFWRIIQVFWWFLFIFIAWFSFYLSSEKYKKEVNKKYIKITLRLFILALLISFFTYIFIPSQFISFWILHFFALWFLLLLIFKNFWYYNLIIAIILFILWFYFPIITEYKYLIFLWIVYKWFYSADYYPIIPYFSYMLFWLIFAKYLSQKNKLSIFYSDSNTRFSNILSFIWKHSLLIYIIHTPIIYAIIYISLKIFN